MCFHALFVFIRVYSWPKAFRRLVLRRHLFALLPYRFLEDARKEGSIKIFGHE
jgi:hypothetical protein